MNCPMCNILLPVGSTYCPSCGRNLATIYGFGLIVGVIFSFWGILLLMDWVMFFSSKGLRGFDGFNLVMFVFTLALLVFGVYSLIQAGKYMAMRRKGH